MISIVLNIICIVALLIVWLKFLEYKKITKKNIEKEKIDILKYDRENYYTELNKERQKVYDNLDNDKKQIFDFILTIPHDYFKFDYNNPNNCTYIAKYKGVEVSLYYNKQWGEFYYECEGLKFNCVNTKYVNDFKEFLKKERQQKYNNKVKGILDRIKNDNNNSNNI